jgi:hypothetical protein
MGSSALLIVFIAATAHGASISRPDSEKQTQVFQRLWNDDFVWKFDDLPTTGDVPKHRIPYSGYIYLDKLGGTSEVLRKYDLAVNRNRSLPATSWEQSDTAEARGSGRGLASLFARPIDWHGHCNGWAAAAVRHAEPEQAVSAYGVEFTPADIKGLLAEVYMYNSTEMLAGYESSLNPGTLHAILANWIGRGSHPVIMDSDPGKEKWNYPIYSFASSFGKHSSRLVEVRTNIAFAIDSEDEEYDRSPRQHELKSFHYMLELNARGEISGGHYLRDSDKIDFVWVPLKPQNPGEEGNQNGNPYIDVEKVLAIWRRSVSTEKRRQWVIVDPTALDRAVEVDDPTALLPKNIRIAPVRTAASADGRVRG